MLRGCAIVACSALAAALLGQEAPKDPEGAFEIEPEILPQNLKDDAALEKAAASSPELDVAKLEKDLARAKRNAASAEHLYKIGALSKVEAEARALKVVRIEADLENARLIDAKAQALSQETEKISEAEAKRNSSDVDLARAIEAAHAAAAKRAQAELEAAELNLGRQQKLLALGSGHKSDVARAEQKLAELKQANQ